MIDALCGIAFSTHPGVTHQPFQILLSFSGEKERLGNQIRDYLRNQDLDRSNPKTCSERSMSVTRCTNLTHSKYSQCAQWLNIMDMVEGLNFDASKEELKVQLAACLPLSSPWAPLQLCKLLSLLQSITCRQEASKLHDTILLEQI